MGIIVAHRVRCLRFKLMEQQEKYIFFKSQCFPRSPARSRLLTPIYSPSKGFFRQENAPQSEAISNLNVYRYQSNW